MKISAEILLQQLQEAELGGFEAQKIYAPPYRSLLSEEEILANNPKYAAVNILLYPKNGEWYFPLILRTHNENDRHSGQISLPGGKKDDTDEDFSDTALRETWEEIGIEKSQIKILRELSPIYIPPSNFLVAPFMGISHEELTFIPDLDEVKRVLEFSIADFLDEKSITKVKMSTSYATDIEVPAFMVDKYVVWGATAMMMSELKETIKCALSKCNF